MDPRGFAAACRTTARGMRYAPPELRRALADRVTPEIATPLAGDIAAAYRGPWAPQLAIGTKARKLADPTIVIGGSRGVVSGGASVRDLVYGNEFGGGGRVTTVHRERRADGSKRRGRISRAERARAASRGQTIYKVHSTRQFRTARPSIIPTIRRRGGWVLDQFANIAVDVLREVISRG